MSKIIKNNYRKYLTYLAWKTNIPFEKVEEIADSMSKAREFNKSVTETKLNQILWDTEKGETTKAEVEVGEKAVARD